MNSDLASQTAYFIEPVLPWDTALRADDVTALDRAAVFSGGFRTDCLLRNISMHGATIHGELRLAPGSEVSLELATGHRPKATTEWINGRDAGLRFKQPVGVVALINRQLLSQPVERRSVPRIEIRAGAWVETAGQLNEAVVRNISSRGLQVETRFLPAIGADVRVFIEGLNVPPAKLVWRQGGVGGLELATELPWATTIQWIRDLARGRQLETTPAS